MAAEVDDHLKQKFLLLEQQQKLRLQKEKDKSRKKPSSGFAKYSSSDEDDGNTNDGSRASIARAKDGSRASIARAFGVEDELDLRLTEPPSPDKKSTAYLSEELVEHLNSQLRELKDESGRLYKLLSERDFEIKQLKKKREEDKLTMTGSSSLSADTAAMKIVQLSKQLREATASLESTKTQVKQTTYKCSQLEKQLLQSQLQKTSQSSPDLEMPEIGELQRSHMEAKLLQERLRVTELKMAEQRNAAQSLKQDLKAAQRVITKEVGKGVTVQELLGASSNWKGRAQLISALQIKVTELKTASNIPLTSRSSDVDLESEFMGTKKRRPEEKQREAIRKTEKERKEAQEKAANELRAMEADQVQLKNKMDAMKARNTVLSNEVKTIREKLAQCASKGKHDDELIEALIGQQAQMKKMIDSLTELTETNQDKQKTQLRDVSAQMQKDSNEVEQLREIMREKEQRIKQLETELGSIKTQEMQQRVSQLFESPSRESITERPSSAHESSHNVADDRIHPVQNGYVTQPSRSDSALSSDSRPASRRAPGSRASVKRAGSVKGNNSKTDGNFRGSNSRLESPGMISPVVRGSRDGRQSAARQGSPIEVEEYRALTQAATVERDRLVELVKVTQQRVNEANASSLEYQREVKVGKQKCVQMEKEVGRLKAEMSKSSGKKGVRDVSHSGVSARGPAESTEDLQTRLAIQRDENEALKAALESTLQAKEEDLRVYCEMIEETKSVFLLGLRQWQTKLKGQANQS